LRGQHPGVLRAVQQDRVDAEARAARRRDVIEKANRLLFNETDAAKGFHSAALLSNVIAERSAQLELKQRARVLHAADDAAFERERVKQRGLAEDAELERLRAARARALELRAAQLAQLEETKRGILAERAAARQEVRRCHADRRRGVHATASLGALCNGLHALSCKHLPSAVGSMSRARSQ
jgi:hypothetical protein